MFEIKKRDVMLGYVAYFFKYASGLLVLPFIVRNLQTSEYAIWSIFLAINTFVILFDMGYGVVIQRYIMYAYSGAKEINYDKVPELIDGLEPNYRLFYHIIIAGKKIYGVISLISVVVLFLLTPYILFITRLDGETATVLTSWIIYSVSVVINMYVLSDATVLKGLGMVGKLQKITLINSIFNTLIRIVTLELGFGLIGLSLSFFAVAILLAFQYKKVTNSFIRKNRELYNECKQSFKDEFSNSFNIIRKKSKGIGGVLISNFIQNQLFTIVAPIFISLDIMGRYNLSWQLVSVVASLSSVAFASYTMRMGNYMVSNMEDKLKSTFALTVSIFLFMFLGGTSVLLIIGDDLLRMIGSNTEILPLSEFALVIIYVFILQVVQKSTTLISLSNNQQYVKSLIISSVSIAIVNITLLWLGFGIREVLINSIIIHSVYNLWKWSTKAFKLCKVNVKDLIKIPISVLKSAF